MKECIIISVIVMLASCNREKNIRIRGELSGSNKETVYLQKLGVDKQTTVVDSVKLDGGGHFSVSYKISVPSFYSLSVNNKSITLLLHPKEKILITGDARQLPLTYDVEGSEDSRHIRQLNIRLEHLSFVRDSLNNLLQQFAGNRNIANIKKQLQWDYIRELDSLRAYNIRFMRDHRTSLTVIYALYQQLAPNTFLFSEEEDVRYFQKADSFFHKRYPKIPHVQMLHNNTMDMAKAYNANKINRMLYMLGTDAPEIALPSPAGKTEKLSAYRGKYVLLDFWASFDPNSRTENTDLVRIYEKYRDKGFNIFQVSLDKSKTAWEKAIKEDGLAWTHVSDLKMWDSEVVKEYNIENLPANFLIDMDGTIIAKELRGDALDKKLSEIFVAIE
ncbi:MAG: TlpA family protein disulfide reductase [Bacteroidales bacterium]|jgi:peroxiredoxin|nr:TlpA family protein disulfide reductase [Bacteroidales bacterium]